MFLGKKKTKAVDEKDDLEKAKVDANLPDDLDLGGLSLTPYDHPGDAASINTHVPGPQTGTRSTEQRPKHHPGDAASINTHVPGPQTGTRNTEQRPQTSPW